MDFFISITISIIVLFSLLNFLFNLFLFKENQSKLYKIQCFFWFSLIINFILQGAFQEGELGIIMAFSFGIIPMIFLSQSSFLIMGESAPIENYLKFSLLCMIATLLLKFTNFSFTFTALPISCAIAAPLLHSSYKILFLDKAKTSTLHKVKAVIMSVYIIHCFNFAFFRMEPEAQMWGWPVAYALYQLLAGILPVLSLEFYHKNEKNRLSQMVSEKTLELRKSLVLNQTLFRIVIHDINSPLTVINSTCSLLEKSINKPDFKEIVSKYMGKSKRAIIKITEIIDQTRKLEAIKSGKQVIELSPVSIEESYLRIKDLLSDVLSNKQITFNYICLQENISILADKCSFENSILLNLITNAIKFSNKGSSILLIASQEGDKTLIEVEDYGTGISPVSIENIFSFEKPTSKPGTLGEIGTGFGLPIVKEYVGLFGGEISVISTLETADKNGYTKFSITIPSCPSSKLDLPDICA